MNNNVKCQYNVENENSEFNDSKFEICPKITDAIEKISDTEGYVHSKIYVKNISPNGGNCFGVLYEINIIGETVEGKKQETNLFVKQVVANSESIKLVSMPEIYRKEIFIYTEIANIFTVLQDEANIPMKERFKFVKIYHNSNTFAIILDNLAKQGFNTYGKMDMIDLDYAELCVEHLARFHALGFIIERRMPEYFESKIKPINQSLATDDSYKVFAKNIYKLSTRKLPSDLKWKVDQWWSTALEDYVKFLRGTMTAVKCLCHGDFKPNNIMYKEENEEITEVIAIDYQLAHYGSPVLDLIYFICLGTDQKFRSQYLCHLKDHYHASLKKCLEYFDVPVDDVYSKNIFERDFNDCLDYGLVSCLCVMPFVLTEDDALPEFVENDIIDIGFKFGDKYYDRLEGVFDDLFSMRSIK